MSDGDFPCTSGTSGLAMNTVPAGRGRRISVPLPASSRTGGPLGRTWATRAATSLLPGGALPVTTVVAAGTAGGERSSAALLATTPIKTDPVVARINNLRITNPTGHRLRCNRTL